MRTQHYIYSTWNSLHFHYTWKHSKNIEKWHFCVLSAEHPKAGQNIQHSFLFLFLFCFIFRLNWLQHCIWFCFVIWHYLPKNLIFWQKFLLFFGPPYKSKRTTFGLAPSNNTFLIQLKFGREKLNLKMAEILNMFREAVWFRGSERGDGVNKAIVVDRKLKHFIDNDVIIGRKLDLRKLFQCRTWLNW